MIILAQKFFLRLIPFGMEEPGKSMSAIPYPYAFNRKRMENVELYTSDQYDYGVRYYDARVGRFYSVDPLARKYRELTPYQFASSMPIDGIDLDGEEVEYYLNKWTKPQNRKPALMKDGFGDIQKQIYKVSVIASNKGLDEFYHDFISDPTSFLSNSKATFEIEYQQNPSHISKGDVLGIELSAPLMNKVSVIVSNIVKTPSGFSTTFQTLKGHVEAGHITFTVTQKGDETSFQINSITRTNNYTVWKTINNTAREKQKESWDEVLNHIARYLGGTITEEYSHINKYKYDEKESNGVGAYEGSDVEVKKSKPNFDYHRNIDN